MSQQDLLQKFNELTDKRKSVLKMMCQGKTDVEIAQALDIKDNTVRSYVRDIAEIFGIDDDTDFSDRRSSKRKNLLEIGQKLGLVTSGFYIERPPIESKCYQEILNLGALIRNRIVYIWDLSSKISTFFKVSQVDYITFSPDGDRIATITKNGVVEIYDLLGRQLAKWEVNPHPDYGVLARFSPDWRYVAIVGEDNKVVVWSVPQNLDELLERGCNWLSSVFANRPDERERLKICQDDE